MLRPKSQSNLPDGFLTYGGENARISLLSLLANLKIASARKRSLTIEDLEVASTRLAGHFGMPDTVFMSPQTYDAYRAAFSGTRSSQDPDKE
jgi:hypothetical protein